MGCVDGPLTTGCTRLVGGILCLDSVGNGLCLPGLTCGFISLLAPCISGTLIPLDFFLGPSLY